jgi:1-acyl-sn-glycerol-3-phosphate acyltransferase
MTNDVHPLAHLIASCGRWISGVQVRWAGCEPSTSCQRIYFANHTSHLDFVVLWSALPAELRARTRPVAAKDYWEQGFRRFLALRVFRAVLLERGAAARAATRQDGKIAAHKIMDRLAEAMGTTDSLILFPEGTRGSGEEVAKFRSGLYYLALQRPDVELVPAYLENLNRILPKGEFLPVPLLSVLTFGAPIHVGAGEEKHAFLGRAREAVCALRCGGGAL